MRSVILRSYGMTSGTWARHSQATTTYDVTELGYNYKLDEPRSAMLMSRLKRLDREIERPDIADVIVHTEPER